MWQRVGAHHLAALAILALLAALGIASHSLAQLANDAAHQTEARLGLLSRVQGLSLERADRDAAFHRVANRLLLTNSRVDTGAAREIVDGARALERKNQAMGTYLAEVSPILPEEERNSFAGAFQLVAQAVSEVVVRAEALAEEPGDSARLESVGTSTRALDEVLLHAQSRVEGALSRGRNRAETIVERTRIWTGSLGAAALVLVAFAARKRALS
ncbi:MAG: hypothetical protein F4Y06_02035 [Rhodospirillales bacterium]|nr:hypothetical protein [Rhodospirillales bacterium]MYE18693.1 hypothetical protein [Rhodospirillales bacterium]